MKCLYVLYDQECLLCQNFRRWLMRQPAYIKLNFIPLQSPEITQRFPGLAEMDLSKELVMVSDEGAVYQGQGAWIMCLYALRPYRAWALRLAHPTLLPFARIACQMISANRIRLSHFLRKPDDELKRTLQAEAPSWCDSRRSCSGDSWGAPEEEALSSPTHWKSPSIPTKAVNATDV